jgi:hypothetical protein
MKYMQKLIAIEALQLTQKPLIKEEWFWDAINNKKIILHNFGKQYPPVWCEIKSRYGNLIAECGDYIVRGLSGEIYPCKAEVFEAGHKVEKEP